MKILYTNFHDADGGGHTTYLRTLAQGLSARHEVHVAVPASSRLNREARAIEGVHVLDQPFPNGLKRLPARLRAKRQLRDYLRTQAFDIVHVNGSADQRLVLSALSGVSPRPRVVLTKHNTKPMQGLGHWLRARRTDAVIGVCEFTRRELMDTPYRRCRIEVVYNGIDVAHWRPWPVDRATTERERWTGGADDVLLLGSNAGTADYKGWTDLVEALARLPQDARERFRVVLAGRLPNEAQRQRIAALGLDSQVQFAGVLADTRPMVAAIDLGFVLSHAVETISFACREMMAMGKPVLLSDYAGLPENIDDGREGWITKTRDIDALAQRLLDVLAQRDRLPAMGADARARAEREFDVGLFVERTEAVYRQLLPR
ncbi:glycosyltransferase family 4 protein [Lysobacter panacisoli]|uniref:Glycosyltransferase n=1 Tax=Lysobacter panacisoli TaxID=1255263 RepID=A0ABP9KZL5_9GAMM|nr:glycosyltransferase family 4 protein [Lysobacter panacisoli]